MFVAKSVKTGHKDLIHDVSFDYYGTRMATCSSDQTVKVWDEGEDGTWRCSASWRTHSASVWRVTWAHPEFGQVLATCSFDRTTAVWEELSSNASVKLGNSTTTWLRRAKLVDSRTSVTDVKFAPRHLGLLLATCSSDGIRIYVAVDVMNLTHWQIQYEFSCNPNPSCLSWSSSRLHPQTIAIGSDDPNPSAGGKVHIYEYSEIARKWQKVETLYTITEPVHDIRFAPNLGRSFDLLAVASRDLNIFSLKRSSSESGNNPSSTSKFEIQQVGNFNDHESLVWRVSWNVTGTILASSGDDGCVRIWKANYLDKWKCISVLKGDGNTSESERAAMFANSMSNTPTSSHIRTHQLQGTASASNLGWPYNELEMDQGKIYY